MNQPALSVAETISLAFANERAGRRAGMRQHEKLLERILQGRSDADIRFAELCRLLRYLGFQERTRGSHHIFRMEGVEERLNLQESGAKAKPYQVRQVRAVLLRHGIGTGT